MQIKINKRRLILAAILLVLTIGVTLIRVDVKSITRPLGKANVDAGVYATLGDTVIYPTAILLGGPLGAAVSAVGAALADIIVAAIRGSTSSRFYIIGSILIKGGMAFFVAAFAAQCVDWKKCFTVAALTEAIMVGAYFIYDVLIVRQFGVAWRGLLVNLGQGVVCGALGAVVLNYLPAARKARQKQRRRQREDEEEDLGVWS